MATVTIKDIPAIEELSEDAAAKIVGGRINLRNEGVDTQLPGEPSGGMGYSGIMIHYTLTVIE